MTESDIESGDSTPEILTRIWDNWRTDEGQGPCRGCPAHWSNRADLPGTAEARTTTYNAAPWYGVGSINPDIAVLGLEPGTLKDEKIDRKKDLRKLSFEQRRDTDIANVARTGTYTLNSLAPFFEHLTEAGQELYWSQVRKCNELEEGDNGTARDHCCGINGHDGYLREELDTMDPEYVVVLGEVAFEKTTELYQLNPQWSDVYSREVAKGDSATGLRMLDVGESFTLIPAPHPGQGWSHLPDEVKEHNHGYDGKKKNWFKQYAIDLLEQMDPSN
jgi:uracil-DNA glycosylase